MITTSKVSELVNCFIPGPRAKQTIKQELKSIVLASFKELTASFACVGISYFFVDKKRPIENWKFLRLAMLPAIKNFFLRGFESFCQYKLQNEKQDSWDSFKINFFQSAIGISRYVRGMIWAEVFDDTIQLLMHEFGHAFFVSLFYQRPDISITLHPLAGGGYTVHHGADYLPNREEMMAKLNELQNQMKGCNLDGIKAELEQFSTKAETIYEPQTKLVELRNRVRDNERIQESVKTVLEKIAANCSQSDPNFTALAHRLKRYISPDLIVDGGGFLFDLITISCCFIGQSIFKTRFCNQELSTYLQCMGLFSLFSTIDYATENSGDAKALKRHGFSPAILKAIIITIPLFFQWMALLKNAIHDLDDFEKKNNIRLAEPNLKSEKPRNLPRSIGNWDRPFHLL